MASFRAEVAFAADIVGTKPNCHWMLEPNARGGFTPAVVKNRIANGEIAAENPSGLPKRHKFHKGQNGAGADEDWYMRWNDRTKTAANGAHTYYPENIFEHKGFQYNAIPKHHSRRVFGKLARQRHGLSESNLMALKEHPELQNEMKQRYEKMMKHKWPRHQEPPPPSQAHPAPPPPVSAEPGSRCSSHTAMTLPSLRSSCKPPDDNVAPKNASDVGAQSGVSASRAQSGLGVDGAAPPMSDEKEVKPASRLSACWPAAAGSSLSAHRPLAAGSSLSVQQLEAPGSTVSGLRPSELPALATSLSAMHTDIEATASQGSLGAGSGMKRSRLSGSFSVSALREPCATSSTVSDFYSWRPKLIR